ncbi:class III extradiol ring-cleavage dioxygenase family protein [Nocardioides bizhenqiangii]|uniref:Uncharacterized protein n=1 Tax=Nocardioides bizhenqiangii TaxID=3095076 RepID=A0ABZ0ZQ58_9ACTN|nr:hypothetical protein [Nocardioides sp. HM61]WQQ25904.1 hypothetical protein SHK19_18295 [Nocardioides sp. HM61]
MSSPRTNAALVPGVPALLPSYASLDDPIADLRAACGAAVAGLGPRVALLASGSGLRVARSLMAETGSEEVTDDATGVLVVGNGSAKRSLKAPGHLDDRAEVFDDDLRRALLAPLPVALAALDQQLAEEMWADVAGIRRLGELLTPAHTAEVLYDAAPFGVQYWVIRWA